MNCCNEMTGKCEQGNGCPARETPMSPSMARRANDHIRMLERRRVGMEHLLTLADTPGNVWDKLPWYGKLAVVCGAVIACSLTAGLLVGYAR